MGKSAPSVPTSPPPRPEPCPWAGAPSASFLKTPPLMSGTTSSPAPVQNSPHVICGFCDRLFAHKNPSSNARPRRSHVRCLSWRPSLAQKLETETQPAQEEKCPTKIPPQPSIERLRKKSWMLQGQSSRSIKRRLRAKPRNLFYAPPAALPLPQIHLRNPPLQAYRKEAPHLVGR